ncbi:unnamed protein product [Closterium sp. NIES-53]
MLGGTVVSGPGRPATTTSAAEPRCVLFLFGSGAVLLRGAGCTINDLLDQDFDAKVARTRSRPLPSGAVTPLGATAFLGFQLLLGLGVLVQLNTYRLLAAGCTINDLLVQDFDAKVAGPSISPSISLRCAFHSHAAKLSWRLNNTLSHVAPIVPSHHMCPVPSIACALCLPSHVPCASHRMCPVPSIACALCLPCSCSQVLGAASLPLVFSYPLMKRFTHWPQAYLGLVFNWGALLGWAAVHGSLHLPAVLPLYMGGICWTLVYDTIYAHQDKADDITAGVKSTALLFAHRTPLYLSLFSAAAITSLAAAGSAVNLGSPFYASLAAAAAHMAWQIASTNFDSREDCYSK